MDHPRIRTVPTPTPHERLEAAQQLRIPVATEDVEALVLHMCGRLLGTLNLHLRMQDPTVLQRQKELLQRARTEELLTPRTFQLAGELIHEFRREAERNCTMQAETSPTRRLQRTPQLTASLGQKVLGFLRGWHGSPTVSPQSLSR